jgi:outer membrane biosynthesis protein TonB
LNLLETLLRDRQPSNNTKKTAIVRVCYGRLGQLLSADIKISSGDLNVDSRALEHVRKLPHSALHHPGRHKKRRLNQWYEIRYFED